MPASRTSARPAAARSGTGARPPGTRPPLTARELAALREVLAQREALAQGATGAPRSAARPPAARKPAGQKPAVRKAPARKATGRTPVTGMPGSRTTATGTTTRTAPRAPVRRKPATRKPTGRRAREAAAAARAARRARWAAARSRWSTRLGVVALSTLLLAAAVTLVLPGARTPGSDGAHDVTALALTAQTTLLRSADRYRQLEAEVTRRRADEEQARAVQRAAAAQVAAQQAVVGSTAADLYRAAPGARYPVPAVHGSATDLLPATAESTGPALASAIARAEQTTATLAAATRRLAEATSATDAAAQRAHGVLAAARSTVAGLSPAVTVQLAALGTVPTAGVEKARNQRALARWQGYLSQLAAAGITPPPAARLTDPAALPDGLSPALDAARKPLPGIAWSVIGSHPVTVLAAETVAAVSNALSQLGKPYVAGATGPATYDCGGFTSASWLLAGYALPATPQGQWAAGASVPMTDLQPGDLVFSPGGHDVGLYLGDGDVLGASAGTFRVGIRGVAAGSAAVRVTVPAPATPHAALTGAEQTGTCGAVLPKPGAATPAWGGWANGQIPAGALCSLGVAGQVLRCDAAASYAQLDAAFAHTFGRPMCITDSYRSYAAQVGAFLTKPELAAVPGTSNHGWALAVDLCGGINIAGSVQWTWMTANAGRFGFVQPDWAGPRGEKPEPWHWEYGYIS